MGRVISRAVSPIIEQFELDGDAVITIDRMTEVMRQLGVGGSPQQLAYALQRGGWLGRLRTRGAWEFLPGARGGAFGSGDRFIEFRAQHATNPEWGGVLAMESAASVLGLAQRLPEQEVVALPDDTPFPKALVGDWRYVRVEVDEEGIADVDGLRAWGFEGLILGIATRPSGYRDVVGLAQWLVSANDSGGDRFNEMRLARLLTGADPAVRQRAAYLLKTLGNHDGAQYLLSRFPPARTTAWLGPREAGGRYDSTTKVNDTLLVPYLAAGSGA